MIDPAPGAQPPDWLDELTLVREPPWLPLGTRALRGELVRRADDAAVVPGTTGRSVAAYRQHLLTTRRDVVSVGLAGHESAAARAAEFVAPAAIVSRVETKPVEVTGDTWSQAWSPLERVALAVEDDLVVLVRDRESWIMAAGVVCFPSHWRPADKLGRSVADIHDPVPGYGHELRGRVDRLLDQLAAGRPIWRRNWTVHASPELHVPEPAAGVPPAEPARLWLRSERQTLAAFDGGIVFTIRTQQVRLGALAARPDVARSLALALAALPAPLAAYRCSTVDPFAVSDWLAKLS
jgi:hypothetical protein